IELDRGRLRAFRGGYEDYLADKKKQLEEEARQNALFDKRLSEEEAWIRQGIKARRTRNEGRVRALKAMREERKSRLERQGTSQLKIESAELSGKQVIEAKNISHAFDDGRPVIKDFSTTIMRGDRVGLIGVNGAGKTTLLRILLDKLRPQSGNVKLGTKLQVAYFDQLREGLDLEKTVFDNVADGHDHVELNGQPRHVMSYLADFLFTAERARTPVKALSGGETNRLLLARLFAKPANMIVLDEPTNDLDVETLELLEERLAEFDGTILLTSHDRDFLDQVVTSTLVFEGQGRIAEYVGGFSDWVRQSGGVLADESTFAAAEKSTQDVQPTPGPVAAVKQEKSDKPKAKKLSYKLQRELDMLPERIDALEQQVAQLQERIAAPEFFTQEHVVVEAVTSELEAAEQGLADAMERWLELSEMAEGES
ncbi:MAG: ATP-binding cassette domain-containing protein, partial [Oleiphilaceae bacterium]|nr:ATP-binding cassette domain-containing protein [Oleiphilaceae bacterium]